MRLACLAVPLFPLAARLRSEPELAQEALVIVEGNGNAARVIAGTRLARGAGIRPGQSLPQARALAPKLIARPRDGECEHTAQESLLEVAESFSPRLEDAGGGVAYLEIDGLERRFPGPDGELDLARALIRGVEGVGLPARVGIASGKLVALVAAGLPESPVIVPRGGEAEFLAPLPLSRLAPEMKVAATLERWGVRSIGDLARLPAAQVVSRLGRIGSEIQATARGQDPHPLIPREPPPSFREGMALEWPLTTLEPFLFVGHAALDRLRQRLEARGFACRRLEIELRLEPDGLQIRSIDLPAATLDVKTLLTLVRLDLERNPPGAAVDGFAFIAHPDRPREAQLNLYGPQALSPGRLAATLARLFALLGPDRVGSPRIVDGHRPERFALVEYAPPPAPEVRRPPRRSRGLLAVRTLRPPLGVEVLTEEILAEGGSHCPRPLEIRILGGANRDPQGGAAKRPEIAGRIQVASGPWGMEEEWWSEEPVLRDYWDVEIAGRGLYRIYRERASGEWYADGIYD